MSQIADAVAAAANPTNVVLGTQWPRDVNGITVVWLSALLGAQVDTFTVAPLTAGAMADACIVTPVYASPPEGTPHRQSVVLKYPKGFAPGRKMAADAGAYKKECLFYSKLADVAGVKTPECLGVWRDPKALDEWFCIAMEDVSVGHDGFTMAAGMEWGTVVDLALVAARMHADNFEAANLGQKWLSALGDDGGWRSSVSSWAGRSSTIPTGAAAASRTRWRMTRRRGLH